MGRLKVNFAAEVIFDSVFYLRSCDDAEGVMWLEHGGDGGGHGGGRGDGDGGRFVSVAAEKSEAAVLGALPEGPKFIEGRPKRRRAGMWRTRRR